jgi:hypothetical protein
VQQDYGGSAQNFGGTDHRVVALGKDAGFSRQDKDQRATEGHYRQRFVASIQNESAHAQTSSGRTRTIA